MINKLLTSRFQKANYLVRKCFFSMCLLITFTVNGQLTVKNVQDTARIRYELSSYSYHADFIGHKNYGAPVIETADGGFAAFGNWTDAKGDASALLVKLDKNGKEVWRKVIAKKYDEQEAQSVVQDKAGNYFVYILEYNQKVYRGGSERVLCYDKTGKLLWDKLIGQFSEVNNPIVSYLKRTDDGRIYMRGHIKLKTGAKAMFWEGWINSKGIMTQKNGEEIDWKKDDWKKRFSPED